MGMEHYIKLKDLGGTNGAFLARDRQQPDRLVVIKRLAEGTQGIEELNASLRLQHPHIIRFLESFVYDGSLFVVMSYESGGDLDRLFRYLILRHKTPTTHTLLLWFVQLLEALVYCHDHHVIHRDIKPSNILVSEDTKILYLGDFGSAKTLNTSSFTSTFIGSPMWISPEVLLGTSYSYATDVWSMGCVFYEMATLRKPFLAPSFAHLVQQITLGHITPLPPHVSTAVKSIIESMLVLDPAQRVTAKEALSVARAALDCAEELRRASPTPMRSPAIPPKPSATPSPPRATLPPEVTAHQPREKPPLPSPQHQSSPSSRTSPGTTPLPIEGLGQTEVPPLPTKSNSKLPTDSGAREPLLVVAAEAKAGEDPTPHGSTITITAATPQSTSHVAVVKRRPGTSSTSTLPESSTFPPLPAPVVEIPAPKQPPAATAVAAAPPAPATAEEAAREDGERLNAAPVEETQLCTPKQMLLQISTADFCRTPAQRQKSAPKRKSAAALKLGLLPKGQRVPRVSAPSVPSNEAPKLVQQLGAESLPTQRTSAATAAARTSAAEPLTPSRGSNGSTKVVTKARPPAHLAKRAVSAADNCDTSPRVLKESPTRKVRGLHTAPLKLGPALPAPPAVHATGTAPYDQWFDQRMRDLRAMENYLHQHRCDDDKALQTYDARRLEEGQQRDSASATRSASKPLPAPRRRSPPKKFAGAAQPLGVLFITPPRHRYVAEDTPAPPAPSAAQQQQRQQRRGGTTAEGHHVAAALPLARQESYTRQVSHPTCGVDLRQNSLSSTYSGRQASNARARPRVSLEEQLKTAEERVVAREKREAERQRMKELIHAQRAAAKRLKRKSKKDGVVDVEIVLPARMPNAVKGVVPVD